MKLLTPILLSTISLTFLFSGCGEPKPAPKVLIDKTLPKVSINGHISDMNAIAFEWKTIKDERVKGINIYRTNPETTSTKLSRIDQTHSSEITHYVDTNVKPNTRYRYRFTSYDENTNESFPNETSEVNTNPRLLSVSYFQTIGNMPRKAKLIWRPHTNSRINTYEIERINEDELKNGDKKWESIVTLQNRLTAEYIDNDLDDESTYYYRLFAISFDNVKSQPSKTIKVTTKSLPLPINDLKASSNIPKEINIQWEKSEQEDIEYYKVYRSGVATSSFDYRVKSLIPNFTDKVKTDGERYFYKITAVDVDGLEGEIPTDAIMGESLKKPKTPSIVKSKIDKNRVTLSWSSSPRAESFTLKKSTKTGWMSSEVQLIKDISKTKYTDSNIENDTLYNYEVIAVDSNGIESLPSKPIKLMYEEN
jgi:fibronectin type 3 domain-containing protein